MRNFSALVLFLFFFAISVFAQSGRVAQPDSTPAATNINAEKMYQEVEAYARLKFAEFEQKKIPFNENLRLQVVREQKQMAAKYAAQLSTIKALTGQDFYYLGLLHWIAENLDGANDNLRLFLKGENPPVEKAQTARSVLMVIDVRRKNIDEAEKILAEYIKNPVKTSERIRMEKELAAAYSETKDFSHAAPHAEEAYRLTKAGFQEYASRVRALAEVLDTGRTVFEIYSESGNQKQADAVLIDLKKTSVVVQSTGIYYFAIDSLVKYMIETNRKAEALGLFAQYLKQIKNDFSEKLLQDQLDDRFERSEKHYNLLGETAPELTEISAWLPGEEKALSSLRGKVVLLDFWATWCGPCIDTFPTLIEMYQTHQKEGLEILGITRYYGQADGEKADKKTELESLERFKQKEMLPYSLVVATDNTNQIIYGAGAIPTAIIIDRKGIIRYVETGNGEGREEEIKAMVEKLLKEK